MTETNVTVTLGTLVTVPTDGSVSPYERSKTRTTPELYPTANRLTVLFSGFFWEPSSRRRNPRLVARSGFSFRETFLVSSRQVNSVAPTRSETSMPRTTPSSHAIATIFWWTGSFAIAFIFARPPETDCAKKE